MTGYLPHALLNYLVRLGWSHGDQEIFSSEEMVELFDIADVNKAASRFDTDKLGWLNQHYLKNDEPASMVARNLDWHLAQAGIDTSQRPRAGRRGVALRDRVHTLEGNGRAREDLVRDRSRSGTTRPSPSTCKNDSAAAVLQRSASAIRLRLDAAKPIHRADRAVAAELELGMGKIAQPLRVAMTGTQVSPSIDHTIFLAGREVALRRIDDAIALAMV